MSGSLMLPDRSSASIRSRPACGGCTASPSCCGRAAATHSRIQRQPCQQADAAAAQRMRRRACATRSSRSPYGTFSAAPIARAAGSNQRASSGSGSASSHQGQANMSRNSVERGESVDSITVAIHRRNRSRTSARSAATCCGIDFAADSRRPAAAVRRLRTEAAIPASPASRNASQASPCSLSAWRRRRRRAARRNSSDIAATCAGRALRRVDAASNSAAIAALLALACGGATTHSAATAPAPARATSHQPGAGGHHEGAGGWWISRRTTRVRILHHATMRSRAARASGNQDSLASSARKRLHAYAARRAATAIAASIGATNSRASAGAARRTRGRARRDGRRCGTAAPPSAARSRADR